ncbi:MAG TPA: DUF4870 domain-containing protein [Thermoanaerobaculia bacterium]|nr:DUF4870 domain-containing protein [Thermoanaerobaculia bacterium]
MTQPSTPPSPPPPPPAPPGASPDSNRTLLLVAAYLWIFAVIPLLVEKEDKEVQWHAKHGLVLFVVEFVLCIVFGVLSAIPLLGCIISIVWLVVGLGILALHVVCIIKAINGERFTVPFISDFANRF